MSELVSIIIPTYNRCNLLAETLESVIRQNYDNWEAIVVDDGSTDQTRDIMRSFCARDKRIKFFVRPKELSKGGNSCRNYGFKKSKGVYVMWLDDDDLLHYEKISRQVSQCSNYKGSISTCAWGRFSEGLNFQLKELKIYRDYDDPINLIRDYGYYGFFPPHVFLVPRELLETVGIWNEDLQINQDGEFFSRVIVNATCVKFAENTFVKYRTHPLNRTSSVNSKSKAKDILRSWNLIENNIPKNRRKETRKYLQNGRKHAYRLLKEAGFKNVILQNLITLYPFIFKDIRKKIKLNAS